MRWALLFLVGCGSPISNELFRADEAFLGALPGTTRLHLPQNLGQLPTNDDLLFDQTAEQLALVEERVSAMILIGEIFRSAQPDERTATSRSWDARPLSTNPGLERTEWWARLRITRIADEADVVWTMEGSVTADGPWLTFADGRRRPDGSGETHWDFPWVGELVGSGGPLVPWTVRYDGQTPRTVEFERERLGFPSTYGFVGETSFVWLDTTEFDDSSSDIALHVVTIAPSGVGRDDGVAFTEEVEAPFRVCWDASGVRLHAEGHGVDSVEGPAGSCPELE